MTRRSIPRCWPASSSCSSELAGDWEYDGEISPETRFLADLGLESLEIVVLATMIQQRYGRLPFAEFLEEIGAAPGRGARPHRRRARRVRLRAPQPHPAGGLTMAPRRCCIGLDGATFTILDPYMERGVMPFLGELDARGTRAPLRSIMPPLTPPAWTSLMTGKHPGQHGVFDFFQKEEPDSVYFRFASSQDVRARDDLVAGQRARPARHVAELPADVPAAARRRVHRARRDDAVAPAAPRLPSAGPVRPAEGAARVQPARDARHGARGQGDRGLPDDEYADWVELHIRREQRWFEIARHLMREEPRRPASACSSTASTSCSTCAGASSTRPAARRSRRLGAGDDRALRALLPHARRDPRRARRPRRPRGDRRAGLRPRLRADPRGLPRQLLAGAGGLPGLGATAAAPRTGRHRGRLRARSRATCTRSTGTRTLAYAATPSSQGITIVGRGAGHRRRRCPRTRAAGS